MANSVRKAAVFGRADVNIRNLPNSKDWMLP